MSVALFLLVGIAGLGLACQSDTVSQPGGPGATGTGGVSGAPVGGTGSELPPRPWNFAAQLLESVTEVPITSVQLAVRAVDNTTGQPLGPETISDASAMIYFNDLPANPIGFVTLAEASQTIDTYEFNIDSSRQDETLRVVAMSSVITAPTFTGIQLDSTKAVAAGAIYWIDPATNVEMPVGCAEVTHSAAEGEIRYFGGNNLPCANAPRAEAPNQEVRVNTNPLNGRYYIANATPGSITVSATLNGQSLGQTTMMIFPGTQSTDGQYSISISNIYVDAPANPTPADCTVDYL